MFPFGNYFVLTSIEVDHQHRAIRFCVDEAFDVENRTELSKLKEGRQALVLTKNKWNHKPQDSIFLIASERNKSFGDFGACSGLYGLSGPYDDIFKPKEPYSVDDDITIKLLVTYHKINQFKIEHHLCNSDYSKVISNIYTAKIKKPNFFGFPQFAVDLF